MALQKQTKELIFSKGIDTNVAPEVLPVGQLHSAENVQTPQRGKFTKAYGSTKFGQTAMNTATDFSGATLGAARTIFTNKNSLYEIQTNVGHSPNSAYTNVSPDDIYAYSPLQNRWAYINKAACVTGESIPLGTGLNVGSFGYLTSLATVDAVYVGGYMFLASVSSAYPTILSIIDVETSNPIVTMTLPDLGYCRLIVLGTRVLAIGQENTGSPTANMIGYNFDSSNIVGIVPIKITFMTDVRTASAAFFDAFVASFNSNLYITYTNNAGQIGVYQYSSVPTTGSATPANFIGIAETTSKCLTIYGGESTYQKIYVAYTKAGTGVRVNICGMTLAGSSLITLYAYEAIGLAGGATTNNVVLFGEFESSAADPNLNITWFWFNGTSGTRMSSLYNYSLSLASKPCYINGLFYIFLRTFENPVSEPTYFLAYLAQESAVTASCMYPVAKMSFGDAGPAPSDAGGGSKVKYLLPQLSLSTTGYYITAGMKATALLSGQYIPQIYKFNFNFNNPNAYLTREISGLTYFTGGFPTCFDGQQFFEACFLISPPQPTNGASAITGLATFDAGTYLISVVYEFVDANGNRHQSAPSIPLSLVVPSSGSAISFDTVTPSMTLHPSIYLAIYITQTNEEVLYYSTRTLVSSATTFSPGKKVSFSITLAPAGNTELLYTTGDVVENQCPTSASAITLWGDRLWYLTDDGVVFSKVITDGFPAGFNPVFNINTVINKGMPTAIGAQRDKLLVFYLDNTYYTTGEGPSDTGDGVFSPLELAAAGVGCVGAASVVEAQDQVFFQSRDGYRTISQALQVVYLGAELDNWINESTVIYSANYFDALHELRITDGSRTYAYDTAFEQWMTRPIAADYKTCLWTGNGVSRRYCHVRASDGAILYEDTSTYLYDSVFVPLVLRTGWISMDQFLGFERLYKVIVLGRYYTAHTLTLKVFYDYTPQVIETHTFASSAGGFAAFTDANVYDNDSYAGNGYPMEVQFKPSVQKCQAIRLEITDGSYVSGTGQSLDVIGMNLVLGVKAVDGKIRSAATGTGSGRPSFIP